MKLPTTDARGKIRAFAFAAACLLPLFAAPSAVHAEDASLSTAPSMTATEASLRFERGEQFERTHDLDLAMAAYQESAEAGNGYAQRKLGDIYGSGNAVVRRDYETSLRWYDKAREQGIEVPAPATMPLEPRFAKPNVR